MPVASTIPASSLRIILFILNPFGRDSRATSILIMMGAKPGVVDFTFNLLRLFISL
jgi:hypothetical protein